MFYIQYNNTSKTQALSSTAYETYADAEIAADLQMEFEPSDSEYVIIEGAKVGRRSKSSNLLRVVYA